MPTQLRYAPMSCPQLKVTSYTTIYTSVNDKFQLSAFSLTYARI